MGRYRLGDIIRMTRKSLSITQEQLSDGICSVETLSRMETGKQNPNRDTYELLMERMGRIRERAYSMLSISDFKVLEKMKRFEDFIQLYDFQQAAALLDDIKKSLGSTILDKQFIIRAENLVRYRLDQIDTDVFLEGLQKAILLTIPRYGTISLANWPLTFNEALILLNISTAYAEKNDYHHAIEILEQVISALKQSYMDEQQRAIMYVSSTFNLSKWYGRVEDYERGITIANEGIEICKKFKLGNALPHLLYSVVWNKEKLIDMGVLSPESRNECLSILKKAYYIALAMKQNNVVQYIDTHIQEQYQLYK